MDHSDLHLYPSQFSNGDQQIQISSYSSLANALGSDPIYPGLQARRPFPADGDQIIHEQAIYHNTPPISNPSFPYPARNISNPSTYPEGVPLSVPNGRLPSGTSVVRSENDDQRDLLRLPPWYDRLPQPSLLDPSVAHWHQAAAEFPTIHFLRKGNKMPYSLWDLLTMDTMPDLVAGDLPILVQNPDRWIKIKLIWPGYSRYPFEKRVPIKRSVALTPALLLMSLAYHIREFVRCIQNEGAVVEPGKERWSVTGVPEGASSVWKNFVIASLQHLTGSVWQPEIYYLRR